MWKKIKNFFLGTAVIIFLVWCGRDHFYWKPKPQSFMPPKSIKFDTDIPLKKYENKVFSFLYPDNWEIEEYAESGQIEVLCKEEETDSTGFNFYTVIITRTTVSANDILQANITELKMKTDTLHYTVVVGDVFKSQFNERTSVCVDYEGYFKERSNWPFYNSLTAFKVGDYGVIMGKTSYKKSDLDAKFKIMEDSFSIRK
jgi:hypothetical protein